MDWSLTVIGASGKEWHLVGGPDDGVGISHGSATGGVGAGAESLFEVVGRPGVRRRAGKTGQLVGEWALVVSDLGHTRAGDVFRAWCRDWQGEVTVRLGVGDDVWSLVAQLPESFSPAGWGFHPEGDADYAVNGWVEVPWSWVSDLGLWFKSYKKDGNNVTVTNFGDGYISPIIEWSGVGGAVSYAGNRFTLPPVGSTRRLSLDTADSFLVTTSSGSRDDALWKQLRGLIKASPLKPGTSTGFVLPAGASLEWKVGVRNPWAH